MKISLNKNLGYGIFLTTGLLLGWILFHSSPAPDSHPGQKEETGQVIWTCSMHPQIRMPAPGKCPICAMDLIPLSSGSSAGYDLDAVRLTEDAKQLANVMSSVVSTGRIQKEVRLYGKVEADEQLLQNQVAHVPGRIEKLFVNFTGEPVRKGQKLAMIYSPELITAQQELLESAKTKQVQPEIYEAAKEKLLRWKLTGSQISEIESSGEVKQDIEVESTTSGIVTARRVSSGDYVGQGSVLYEVSDLSKVWVLFDAYESDLPFLKNGDRIGFTVQALPAEKFSGTIRFIDPVIDPVNRVARVRIEIANPGGKLKPGMFATGLVESRPEGYADKIVVPRSAILWTGKRSVVYVKLPGIDQPVYKMRDVELGPQLGDSFIVMEGLSAGEEIVTHGAFSIDAAAQLEGKPSMMNSALGAENPGGNVSGGLSAAPVEIIEIKVAGNCDICRERIETAAKSVSGVRSAEWSAGSQMLKLSFVSGETSSDEVQKVIAGVGHDTEKYKAPDEVYNKLPECCLYKRFSYLP